MTKKKKQNLLAKIALATSLTGLVTFIVGVGLILVRFGFFGGVG